MNARHALPGRPTTPHLSLLLALLAAAPATAQELKSGIARDPLGGAIYSIEAGSPPVPLRIQTRSNLTTASNWTTVDAVTTVSNSLLWPDPLKRTNQQFYYRAVKAPP